MKKSLTIILAVFAALHLNAQNGAAINNSGNIADPSAMLDISSTSSGILIPRMSEAQKLAITNPAVGLMIYQTDNTTGFWYYNGTIWVQSIGATGPAGSTGTAGATGPAGPAGLLTPGASAGNTPYWDGTQWVINSSNIYNNGGSVGIGTTNPNTYASLELSGVSKGFLINRMTTAERNSILSPVDGLQIYNTTTKCLEVYINPVWQSIYCGCSSPTPPTSGTHTATETQINWSWNAVSGASGYKINTNNDYLTATDAGTNLTYTQTGLNCNTLYTLYVWAYGICGNSSSATLTKSTSACFVCGATVAFTYSGSTVSYGTVNGQNGTCWLNRNLGASQVATSYSDALAYGDLFQWGRGDDGHQLRGNNVTTATLSSNDNPGHASFIVTSSSPFDWRSPQNNNLWQGATGINNPCPAGWRIPTETELENERLSWSTKDNSGAFASSLKLTAAGGRYYDGSLYNIGNGKYWTSTIDGTNAHYLAIGDSYAVMDNHYRSLGMSVRCIRN